MSTLAAVAEEDPRDCWRTPGRLFAALNSRYRFEVDAAADETNHRCEYFWTIHNDGVECLRNSNQRAFANPPYSNIAPWVDAALSRWINHDALTVLLLPARTDQRWFSALASEADLFFFRGRVRFEPPPGIAASSNRDPSVLAVFNPADKFNRPRSICPKTGAIL